MYSAVQRPGQVRQNMQMMPASGVHCIHMLAQHPYSISKSIYLTSFIKLWTEINSGNAKHYYRRNKTRLYKDNAYDVGLLGRALFSTTL